MKIPHDRWHYEWKPKAEEQLAELWNDARDRTTLTEASAAIDAALTEDPTAVGESRFAYEFVAARRIDLRIAFIGPLMIVFGLSVPERSVTVASVRRTRPGPTERRD